MCVFFKYATVNIFLCLFVRVVNWICQACSVPALMEMCVRAWVIVGVPVRVRVHVNALSHVSLSQERVMIFNDGILLPGCHWNCTHCWTIVDWSQCQGIREQDKCTKPPVKATDSFDYCAFGCVRVSPYMYGCANDRKVDSTKILKSLKQF